MRLKPFRRIDPYFNDIPYEFITDDRGKVLAEVYVLPYKQLNDGLIKKAKGGESFGK